MCGKHRIVLIVILFNSSIVLFFQSAYSEEACKNIITEEGFGHGPLRRDHGYELMKGVNYLILGQENPNNLGLPDVPSIEFR